MNDLFAPPGVVWKPVSPRLAVLRRLTTAITVVVAGLVVVPALWVLLGGWYAALAALVLLAAYVASWVLIARSQRSWRYAEREDDLLITHGVLFWELVVVPYGRMQFVDVAAGPLERAFGLATVELHTATPATDAKIPGLTPDEAARLRDRLSALGQAQAWGL